MPARSFLVVDIETIIDAELPLSAKVEQHPPSLPPAPHHQVVAIGVLWMDASYHPIRLGIVAEHKSEELILSDYARFVDERRPTLVTYNGRGFDLPVIVARCLRHAIPLRHYFQEHDVRYRFTASGHFDLMDYLSDFGATRPVSLDTMAKLIGLPGKVGVDGKDVGPMVHAGRLGEVYAYCLCDVVQTAALFLRVELVRGQIDGLTYRRAMGELLDAMAADSRLDPVSQAVDKERLLGAGPAPSGAPGAQAAPPADEP